MAEFKSLSNIFLSQIKIVSNFGIYDCKIVYSIVHLPSYKSICKLLYNNLLF